MEGHFTTPIPALTAEELAAIERAASGPGRLAKSWTQLTLLIRERLGTGAAKKPRARLRQYGNGTSYAVFRLGAAADVAIEFGFINAQHERQRLGALQARWDELGLTGPYRIVIRGREHKLGTFGAVLEQYLTLPEIH